MSDSTRENTNPESNSENNREFPPTAPSGQERNWASNANPQSDAMDIDDPTANGFIFSRQELDRSVTLVNDPLDRWSIENLPNRLGQDMARIYDVCKNRLGGINEKRLEMIFKIVEQTLDSVFSSDLVKKLAKPPFNSLITHILDTNMTVSRQNLLYPELTFHRVKIGSLATFNLVEKVAYLCDFEFKLLQRLNQIEGFSERFANCQDMKDVIRKAESPSALSDGEEITRILNHILKTLLNPSNAREFYANWQEIPLPNTECAKFIRQLNLKGAFIPWYLFVAFKFKNRTSVVKTLTYYFGRFKDGERIQTDRVISDITNDPGFVTDLKSLKITTEETFQRLEGKDKANNGNKNSNNKTKLGGKKKKVLKPNSDNAKKQKSDQRSKSFKKKDSKSDS